MRIGVETSFVSSAIDDQLLVTGFIQRLLLSIETEFFFYFSWILNIVAFETLKTAIGLIVSIVLP